MPRPRGSGTGVLPRPSDASAPRQGTLGKRTVTREEMEQVGAQAELPDHQRTEGDEQQPLEGPPAGPRRPVRRKTPMRSMNVAAIPCENRLGAGAAASLEGFWRRVARRSWSRSKGLALGTRALHQSTADRMRNRAGD